ncbi:MAG: hypothetical protein Q4C72_02895 [Eubacteriales bacterium]|nr:hypothetical protein [Eubacteriales bacterium]
MKIAERFSRFMPRPQDAGAVAQGGRLAAEGRLPCGWDLQSKSRIHAG